MSAPNPPESAQPASVPAAQPVPGQPLPPGFIAPPAAVPEFPAPPPKRKHTGLIVSLVIAGVVLLALCAVGAVLLVRTVGQVVATDPANAEVDDCLAGTTAEELNADRLKIVDCAEPTAQFKVVSIVSDTLNEESEQACTGSGVDFEYYYWSGAEGKHGTVLCLVEAR